MKYVIINDNEGIIKRISSQLELYRSLGREWHDLDVSAFLSALPVMTDTVILGYGRDLYDKLLDLHKKNVIHLGLRGFNYPEFCELPQVYIGSNILVFGDRPYLNTVPGTEVYIKGMDGILHPVDPNLHFFFGDAIKRGPLKLPNVNIVGLREGIEILNKVFIPDTKSWVGFDYETNGFPEDVGFEISGFALAKDDISYFFDYRKDYGYISTNKPEDYDSTILAEFNSTFREYLRINAHNIWAYNCTFEMNVLYRVYHEFIYIQDSYALTLADDRRGSLKYNVQYYLRCPSWDDTLDLEQDYIREFMNAYGVDERLNRWNEFYSDLLKYSSDNTALDNKFRFDKSPLLKDAFDYYVNDLPGGTGLHGFPVGTFIQLLKDNWSHGTDWFACNPIELGTYCCYDSFYGMKLAKMLYPAYKDCYKAFLFNKYMGMELKLNGIKIDLDKLGQYKKYCENIIFNYEVFMNKIYLSLYFRNCKDYYNDIEIDPSLFKVLEVYPECATNDPVLLSKNLFTKILESNSDYVNMLENEHKLPRDIFNDILGVDISDELSILDEEIGDSLTSFNRKRSIHKTVGELLMNVLGTTRYLKNFNKSIISIIKDAYLEVYDKYNKLWVFNEEIPLTDSWLVINALKAWSRKGGNTRDLVANYRGNEIHFRSILFETFEKAIDDYNKGKGPRVSTSLETIKDLRYDDLLVLLQVPEQYMDIIYTIRDIYDDWYLDKSIDTWIPESVINMYDGIHGPAINAFEYIRYKILYEEAKTVFRSDIRIMEDPRVGTKYEGKPLDSYLGKIINYWSPTQFPQLFGEMIRTFYEDKLAIMSICWRYIEKNVDYDKRAEYDTIGTLREFISRKDELVGTKEYYNILHITDKDDPDFGKKQPISSDTFGCYDYGFCVDAYFNSVFGGSQLDAYGIRMEIPDDELLMLIKMASFVDYASVARKEWSTYIAALERGYKKVRYKDDSGKEMYSGYFSSGEDDGINKGDEIGAKDTYLPTFSMNTVNTKRCSSPYHTFTHYSNSMECLTVEEGRIKTYFDVSQMEPRSVALT